MRQDPFRLLEDEHQEALAALDRLELAAHHLRVDPASESDLATARSVLQILATTVREHNEKEEAALFPLLREVAPIEVFEDEHRTAWTLERELARLLEKATADERAVQVALDLVALLRQHIARENEVLFPMARSLLGPDGTESLGHRLS
jgi:hemerythrin-like domain-containing protein